MENGTSLDDILNKEPTTEGATQLETIGQQRDEHGRFAPQDTGEEPPVETPAAEEGPPPSEQEQSHIPIAALKDERTKRQQLEEQNRQIADRLQQYEAYFNELNQTVQEQGPPDPVTDPAGYGQWVMAQVQSQIMPNVQQTGQQYIDLARVEVAETLARQKYADYDEKIEQFKQAVQANPFLLQELKAAPNPAEYAYNAAAKILEAKQYGTASPSREQLEAEIRQKIMAEIGLPNRQAPTSLANERSVGSRTGPAWSGPTALSDIIG